MDRVLEKTAAARGLKNKHLKNFLPVCKMIAELEESLVATQGVELNELTNHEHKSLEMLRLCREFEDSTMKVYKQLHSELEQALVYCHDELLTVDDDDVDAEAQVGLLRGKLLAIHRLQDDQRDICKELEHLVEDKLALAGKCLWQLQITESSTSDCMGYYV